MNSIEALTNFDKQNIWHPYSSFSASSNNYLVEKAIGVELFLKTGEVLIDGMSSWWSAIHGYNHATLNNAIQTQLSKMSHVMFGGLTHEPAIELASQLVDITPEKVNKVFFCDSGSVAVEVAIKMAFQYYISLGLKNKNKLVSLKSGYHGDTFFAMSVCDPITGMHHIFNEILPEQIFVAQPSVRFSDSWEPKAMDNIRKTLENNHESIAAFILEPIVQGAGGMWFYHPQFLKEIRSLCDEYNILLIADEIATGFGRTGKMFACEFANISPDILCIGKAITGGYMSFAATLCSSEIADVLSSKGPGVFMHGPTFMGNPLAASVSIANLALLKENDWNTSVSQISEQLTKYLLPLKENDHVKDIRVLGAIGVVEMTTTINIPKIQSFLIKEGVWLRPFGKLLYTMPPYCINNNQLKKLCLAIEKAIRTIHF